jgi:glycine betaine/proline transport system ATP-binding protein
VTDAALACRNIWKLYGPDPKGLLARLGPAPSAAALKDAGYITAVADATLDVARGEIFVIMGLSGSGKSTLVRCLARLIEPSAGEVIFAGRKLLDASPQELIELRRHKMGMVFQHSRSCRISPCSTTSPFRSRSRVLRARSARRARAR